VFVIPTFFEQDYGFSIDIVLENIPADMPSDVVPEVVLTLPDGSKKKRTGSADGITFNASSATISMMIRIGKGDLSPPGSYALRVRLKKDETITLTAPQRQLFDVLGEQDE
jgi:hypothetical protein